MRIDQALSILRRTGFVILVVVSSLAKAQVGPSLEREQAHGRVDAAVQILECLSGASVAGVSPETPDPRSRVAVARHIDKSELRRAHIEYFAMLHWAPRCSRLPLRPAGSQRLGRCRTARSKARRARASGRLSARRGARRRRRARPAVYAPRVIPPHQQFVAKRSPRRRFDNPMWCDAPAARFRRSRLQPSCQPPYRRSDRLNPTHRCGTAPEEVSMPPGAFTCVQPIYLTKDLQ